MTFDQGADKQQISRRVVDLVHRHQKPMLLLCLLIRLATNERRLAAFIERR
jgi:hypothetical protein